MARKPISKSTAKTAGSATATRKGKPASKARQADTTKLVKQVAREVKATGRLRSQTTGRWIKNTPRNFVRQVTKLQKETTRNTRQIERTAKQAAKLAREIAGLFKGSKQAQPTKQTSKPGKSSRSTSKPKKQTSKRSTPTRLKPVPPSAPKRSPSKVIKQKAIKFTSSRVYELADLPETFNNATMNGTLEELRENADNYDTYLKPGDRFAMRIGYRNKSGNFVGGYSYESFDDFELLVNRLEQYKFVEEFGDDPDSWPDLADLVKVIRFKAPNVKKPSDQQTKVAWREKKQAELTKRIEKRETRRTQRKLNEKELRRQTREAKKRADELMKAAQEQAFENRRLRALLREQGREPKQKKGGKKK